MKKTLLLFIPIAVASQLKAQQLFPAQPADSLLNKFWVKPNNSFQSFQPNLNLNQPLSRAFVNISSIDHMPVVALNGNSKMPVVKLGGFYTMPVKRIDSDDQFPAGADLHPGSPVFKAP
jgi:hypothetical protein